MVNNSLPFDDALLRELNKRPEDPLNDRGDHENAERNHGNDDAASREFAFQPERPSEDEHRHSPTSQREGTGGEKVKQGRADSLLDVAVHWAWITIFSILGTLSRLGLQSLNDYSGHLIPPLVWAQFLGCAVMGFVTEYNRLFPKKAPKNDALYLGITVGYCGSTTSFSAWILQVYEDLANTDGYARPKGYNIISILTQVMVTMAASLAAFRLGNHLAIFADSLIPLRAVPRLTSRPVMCLLCIVAIGFQAGTIITSGLRRDWRGTVAFAMVFSPVGALSRWYLSRTMNGINPAFPLGTFTANMVGSFLEGVFHLLQFHVGGGNACSLLQGLQDGYCEMDHHCPWLATCIGFRNQKQFVQFLLYVSLWCGIMCTVSGIFLHDFFTVNQPEETEPQFLPINWVVLLVVSGVVALVVGGFGAWHVSLILRNYTTIEHMEETRFKGDQRRYLQAQSPKDKFNIFNLTYRENWSQVFGDSVIMWFIPIASNDKLDGLNFPISEKARERLQVQQNLHSFERDQYDPHQDGRRYELNDYRDSEEWTRNQAA
ncbi:Predicted protein [Taphrina deformans PYCC 5710]|uniref:Palmitoyltransferase n=1 Tax=Taphrina deformans (strain PYCC 5710 / ATCC 11124 / CBS 356.35 / IMI 108563 / JCM 9778 / NBRC 8474) TaxID=1097556 RepID=R4X8S9_TAPDE|nr:Predicted protein [Taphrina deformans PYCC 5710]|eukprot:CCG82059.1 Predicted protein [Taphrina deformans PYCC 5710]